MYNNILVAELPGGADVVVMAGAWVTVFGVEASPGVTEKRGISLTSNFKKVA